MQNRLMLNVAKPKAIVIGSYFYINQLSGMETKGVSFGETFVKFKKSVRSLGVVLDHKVNWKEQVSNTYRKAFSLLYRLNFFHKSTTFELRHHLIKALLLPILDYCSLVLCDISQEMDKKLQTIMNRIRYIYGIRKREHITPYRSSLQWLTTYERRDFFTTVLLYRIFTSGKPSYLACRYIANESNHPVRRYKQPLCIPAFQKEFLRNSFYVTSSYL